MKHCLIQHMDRGYYGGCSGGNGGVATIFFTFFDSSCSASVLPFHHHPRMLFTCEHSIVSCFVCAMAMLCLRIRRG